jgi:hypothetical protein
MSKGFIDQDAGQAAATKAHRPASNFGFNPAEAETAKDNAVYMAAAGASQLKTRTAENRAAMQNAADEADAGYQKARAARQAKTSRKYK